MSPITGQVWQKSKKMVWKVSAHLDTSSKFIPIRHSDPLTLEPSHDILGCVEHQRIISGQRHLSNSVNWQIAKNSRPNSRSPTLRPRWKKSEKGLLIICPGQRETPKTQLSRLPTGSTSTALKWSHKSQSKIYHLYRSKLSQHLQQTLPTHIIKKNTPPDSNLKKEGIVR